MLALGFLSTSALVVLAFVGGVVASVLFSRANPNKVAKVNTAIGKL